MNIDAKIKRNNVPDTPYGNWYICRDTCASHGSYDYLHNDGQWRGSTRGTDGVWSGYYKTEEDAKAMLARASML